MHVRRGKHVVVPQRFFDVDADDRSDAAQHRPRSRLPCRWLLEEEALGQKRRRNVVGILCGYAAGAKMVPPRAERRDQPLDFPSSGLGCQSESSALGEQVINARRPAVGADRHCEIAALETDQTCGHEVVSRCQAPAARRAAYRVVAGMVVVVRDGAVEDDAPEELGAIGSARSVGSHPIDLGSPPPLALSRVADKWPISLDLSATGR